MTAPLKLPPPILIQTPDDLQTMLAGLDDITRCAIDTESNSLYAYYHRVCLIQLSTDSTDYIIDPLAIPELTPFKTWIATHPIEFTFHAAENDLLLLDRDFGIRFQHIFDTLWAARILGWQRPSLASILEEHFGVKLDKRWQRTDWGRRPLTPEQLSYARLDTHYLLALRDLLARQLQQKQRWQEARDMFAELVHIRWQEKPRPDMWRLRGLRELDDQQLAVCQALFDWREKQAQRRNRPPFKIMRNETLLYLARRQPATLAELRQTPGLPRRLPPRVARRILHVIRQGQHAPTPTPPVHPPRGSMPSSAERAVYETLRSWRSQQAHERGVDADVILTNHVLMTLARQQPQTMDELAALHLLGEWKMQQYGPAIIDICRKAGEKETAGED